MIWIPEDGGDLQEAVGKAVRLLTSNQPTRGKRAAVEIVLIAVHRRPNIHRDELSARREADYKKDPIKPSKAALALECEESTLSRENCKVVLMPLGEAD